MSRGRIMLAVIAAVNVAVIAFALWSGIGRVAVLNVVGEAALISAVADHPRKLWTPVHVDDREVVS